MSSWTARRPSAKRSARRPSMRASMVWQSTGSVVASRRRRNFKRKNAARSSRVFTRSRSTASKSSGSGITARTHKQVAHGRRMPETVAHCEDATYIQFMRDLAQATTVGSLNVLYDRQRVRGVALRTGLDGLTADPLPSPSAYRISDSGSIGRPRPARSTTVPSFAGGTACCRSTSQPARERQMVQPRPCVTSTGLARSDVRTKSTG